MVNALLKLSCRLIRLQMSAVGSMIVGLLALVGLLLISTWAYTRYRADRFGAQAVATVTTPVVAAAPPAVATTAPAPVMTPAVVTTTTVTKAAPTAPATVQVTQVEAPTLPPPCVAPPLVGVAPAMTACGCPVNGVAFPQASRQDLFPGSYITFNFATPEVCGPADDLRNRRC